MTMTSYREKYLEYKTKYLLATMELEGSGRLRRALTRQFSTPVTANELNRAKTHDDPKKVSSWIQMHDNYTDMASKMASKMTSIYARNNEHVSKESSSQPSGLVIRHLMSCNNQHDKDNNFKKNKEKLLNNYDPHISLYGAKSGYDYFTSDNFKNEKIDLSELITQTTDTDVQYSIHTSILIRTWETAFVLFCGIVKNRQNSPDTDKNLILSLYITPYAKESHDGFLKTWNYGNVPNVDMKIQILRFLNFLSSNEIKSIYPRDKMTVNLKYVQETPTKGNQDANDTISNQENDDTIFSITLNREKSFEDYVKRDDDTSILQLNQYTFGGANNDGGTTDHNAKWTNKSDTSKYNAFSFFVEKKTATDDTNIKFTVNNVAKGIPNTKHADFDKSNLSNNTPWICRDTSMIKKCLSTYSFEGYRDSIETFNQKFTKNNAIDWESSFIKTDLHSAINLIQNKFFLLVAHSDVMSKYLESLLSQNN